ncbi:MAG: radical SAM protein [Nanoarchaeota archaeon]|nr:radical SAM protein [Nanoarchaeota archaeon]
MRNYDFSEQALENARLNIEEMKKKKIILESLPFKLYIEPTQNCNLNCIMCWKKRRRKKRDIKLKMYNNIVKELFPFMCEVNFFLVGEPFLAKNFLDLLKPIENYSFLPKIFTNGTIFSEEIYRRLIELGFFVNISFDAATKDVFERIRVGSKYDMILKNIEKIKTLSSEIGNKRFHVRLVITAGSYNIKEVPKIVELAHKIKINDIMVLDCDMGRPHSYNLMNVKDETKKIFEESMTLANKYKIRLSFPKNIGNEQLLKKNHNWDKFSLPIDKYAPSFLEEYNPVNGDCPHPWIETAIRNDGTVVACCQKLIKMGNINRHTFKKIWNNKRYQKLRKRTQYYDCQNYCLLTRNSMMKGNKIR